VDNSSIQVGQDGLFLATNLLTLDTVPLNLISNGTFLATNLVAYRNSDIPMYPERNFQPGLLTDIYASRLSVSGGSTLRVAALGYDTPDDWRWSPTLFLADGAGSLLDLSAMKNLRVRWGYNGARIYSAIANNGGVLDWSGLETITGPEEGDDWLAIAASSGGRIKLGNVDAWRQVRFTASGTGSKLEANGLLLRPVIELSVSGNSLLSVKGDFLYQNTNANNILVEGAYFQMDGAQPQRLEVGGRDSGPSGFTSRNFGYSQLIVGSSNQTSVVRLVDTLNNGNRGAAGEPEALYLYGMDGAGLRILNGSRLVLNGLNAYASVSGQMQSLRSLIPAGSNSVPFDGGFIANFGGPRITNMTPAVAVTPVVSSVDVAFDQPIQASSFTLADVNLTGPGGALPATGVSLVGGTTWRISFAAQSADGTYTVRVGPNINELAANLTGLDQNQDGLSGDGTNDTFVGSFAIDGTAPTVVGAYALQNGNRVGLTFSEVVVPAFATNPANYSVNGAAPTGVALRANGTQVVLTVSPTIGVTFPMVVSNAVDSLGNTANRTVTGTILPLEPKDIGSPGSDPRDTGSTVAFSETDFDSVGGGSGVWGTSDAFHLVSEQRIGDFDVRVQITRLDRTRAISDGGIMLRQTLVANSPKVQATIEPYSGGQRFYLGVRSTAGGNVSYPAGVVSSDNWIRMQRQGPVFIGYRGTNGLDWIEYARLTNSFPTAGYLGLGTCSDDNTAGRAVTAYYRNYSDFAPSILTQPQSQSVASGANVTFGVTARGLPTLTYQWQLNGIPLPGETNTSLTLLGVTTNRVGSYRAVVSNPYGTATSQEATLTVDGAGCGSFEADMAPRPTGNNAITVSDWVQVGRLVAGLDSTLNACEFSRADCAPRTNALLGTMPLGDGRLSVADWTQAGRYAAGVDPLTPSGGPTAPAAPALGGNGRVLPDGHASKDGSVRSVRLVGSKVVQGQSFSVPVELTALGGENALGFSVQFDPARLTYLGVALADDAAGASLQVNTLQAGAGAVGLVLAKSFGQMFGAGTTSVVRLEFRAVGPAGTNKVEFADTPVWREIADAAANVQPAVYVAGTVRVVAPGVLSPDVRLDAGGVELRLTGEPGERYRVEVSPDLKQWLSVSTVTVGVGPVVVRDAAVVGERQRFYRAVLVP